MTIDDMKAFIGYYEYLENRLSVLRHMLSVDPNDIAAAREEKRVTELFLASAELMHHHGLEP